MNEQFDSKFSVKIVTTEEEIKKLTHLTSYAFIPAPTDLTKPQIGFESLKNSFIQSVYPKDQEFPVATATCIPMTQNVRGKIFKMGGIAAVATQPEYRMQGIIRHLMTNIFIHAQEIGEIFSTLFPFKESFYAKFGYISLPQNKIGTFSIEKLSSIRDMKLAGTVKHFYLKDVFDQYYNFTVEVQAKIHGMSIASKETTDFINVSKPSYVAFAYENNKITGCFVYTTKGAGGPVDIRYFYYVNANAKYLLLQFLARHIDQFTQVNLPILPTENQELWLNDLSLKVSTRTWANNPMGRIMNVEGLQGIQVGTGSLIIKIIDEQCEWNEGIFTFSSNNGILNVKKESNDEFKADCSLTISGLTALVYGGYNIEDFPFRNWITNYPTSKEFFQKIKELFTPVIPFMHEDF